MVNARAIYLLFDFFRCINEDIGAVNKNAGAGAAIGDAFVAGFNANATMTARFGYSD
jgi:hypothetical protein